MESHKRPIEIRQQIKEWMKEWADNPLSPESFDKGAQGALLGHTQKALPTIKVAESRERGVDKSYNRHLVLGYLFGDPAAPFEPMRSGGFTAEMWFALSRWIGAEQGTDGKWSPKLGFKREAKWVWNFADYCMIRTDEESDLPFGALLMEDDENNWPSPDDEANLDESLVQQSIDIGHEHTDEIVKTPTGAWSGDEPIQFAKTTSGGIPIIERDGSSADDLDTESRSSADVTVKENKKPLSEQMLIPDEW